MEIPITVLMSVYNGERFLKQSINSVLNQSFKEFEFIIIDDGSTDNSEIIIKEFANIDRRIRFIKKKNSGLTQSLNLGIKMARGEWIARIDDDDICEPNRFETQYSYAKSNQSLVLIGSNFFKISESSLKLKLYKYPNKHDQLKKILLKKKFSFPHSSYFIKKKSIKRINGYNERLKRSQDYDLSLRLSEIGKLACISEPLVCIRKHEHQVSNENNGISQLIYCHVALISFFLRKKGFNDPLSNSESEDSFEEFYQFVKNDNSLKKLFKFKKIIEELKFNILKFNLLKIFQLLIRYFFSLSYYLFLKIINKNIEIGILNKWINRKKI